MNPGDLREVVTIQTQSNATSGDFGRPSSGDEAQWSDAATIRAEVRERAASTTERGGRSVQDWDVTMKVRPHPDLSKNARLKYNGDTYRIQSIRRMGRMQRYREIEAIYSGD